MGDYALYFDGVNDYVRVPSTPLLNPQEFTITLWVKIPPGLRGRIITKGRGATGILPFWLDMSTGGALRFLVGDGPNSYAVLYPPRVNDDQWHFIVLVLDRANKQMRMRVDQRPWGRTDFTVLDDTSSLEDMFLGIEVTMSWPLRGTIDEIKIYNRVLEDYEVDYWWNNGLGRYGYPTELGLVAGYHLDENSGVTCYDFSGHGHNGTLTGALWTEGYVREGVITMPTVISHVKFGIVPVAAVPERVVALWAEGLKKRAPEIYQRLTQLIPDKTAFTEIIADRANLNWLRFVAPDFVSEGGQDKAAIDTSHAEKLRQAYEKWFTQLSHLFETVDGIPAKRFQDLVEANRSAYLQGVAKRVLPFTGLAVEGRGPVPKAALWLTGNQKVNRMLTAADTVLEGGPYRVCPRTKIPGLRAMLVQRLIQAGNNIIKANYEPAVIAAENQKTNEQVQGFVDPVLNLVPFVAGGDSKVDYIIDENKQLYLEIKVSKM